MTHMLTKGLNDWHRFVEARDIALLSDLVHEDVLFHSPSGHTPYGGQRATLTALGAVMTIFENFRYEREFINEEAHSVVLEFAAQIEGRDLKGFDIIRFDQDGKIIEFEVAIRPLAMVARLAELMAEKTTHIMADLKVAKQ